MNQRMPTATFELDPVPVKVTSDRYGLKEVQHQGLSYNLVKGVLNIKLGDKKYLSLKETFLNHDIGLVVKPAPDALREKLNSPSPRIIGESEAKVKVAGSKDDVKFYRATSVAYDPRNSSLDVKLDKNHVIRITGHELARETGIFLDAFERNYSRAR